MNDIKDTGQSFATVSETVAEFSHRGLNAPPKLIERDSFGLIKQNISYSYDQAGYINWRSLIPPEFLYLNPESSRRTQIEKKYGKPFNEINILTDKVEDKDLCILLGGLRYLLKLRGYKSVKYTITQSNFEYCSVNCSIVFTGNYETGGQDIEYSDSASATSNNTASFYRNYLVEAATNRAFCRTVRAFLGISIVSKEELSDKNAVVDSSEELNNSTDPRDMLKDVLKKKDRTFAELKAKLIKAGVEGAETWETIDQIPAPKIFEALDIINKKK